MNEKTEMELNLAMHRYPFSFPPNFDNDNCPALWQNPDEWYTFVHLLIELDCRSVLVVGTSWGRDVNFLNDISFFHCVMGVDKEPKRKAFGVMEYDYLKHGDLPRMPSFDAVFLDADHSYEGTKRAYEITMTWVKPRRLVAFHDIYSRSSTDKYPLDFGVVDYWQREHKGKRGRMEIGVPFSQECCGIGVYLLK